MLIIGAAKSHWREMVESHHLNYWKCKACGWLDHSHVATITAFPCDFVNCLLHLICFLCQIKIWCYNITLCWLRRLLLLLYQKRDCRRKAQVFCPTTNGPHGICYLLRAFPRCCLGWNITVTNLQYHAQCDLMAVPLYCLLRQYVGPLKWAPPLSLI